MSAESVLVFDIEAKFGFFKIAEVTRATLSFPFTRTSIIGLIAAILGKNRNTYWNVDDPLANAKIALEFINPIQHTPLTFNYVHTRNRVSIGSGRISSFLSRGKERGFVTAVRLDLIRNIHFRIYFKSENLELFNTFKKYLENNWSCYHTYLGHANLLADIIFIGDFSLGTLSKKEAEVYSVIPTSILDINFMDTIGPYFTLITKIPIRSIIKDGEVIDTVKENFIIQDKLNKSIKIRVKNVHNIYKTQVNEEKKNIVFMPDGRDSEREPVDSIINKEKQ